MRKALLVWIIPVVVVLAAVVVGFWLKGGRKPGRPVRIAYQPMIVSLPIYAAKERGLFEAHDVEIEHHVMHSGNDALNALIAGQVDILPSQSIIPILHLELQNPGVVRLYATGLMRKDNAFDSIIVKMDSPIESLHDLAGRRIGLFPGTTAPNLLRALMEREGVDSSTTTFVALPPPAQIGSLESGAVDALFSYEPITTVALDKGGYRTIHGSVYASLIDPAPIGASVVSRRFEREHPRLAERAIKALDEATQFVSENLDEARELLPRYAEIPPSLAPRVNVVVTQAAGRIDVEMLQGFIDLLHEIGELPRTIDAERLIAEDL